MKPIRKLERPLSITLIANLLDVSPKTIYKWLATEQLKSRFIEDVMKYYAEFVFKKE